MEKKRCIFRWKSPEYRRTLPALIFRFGSVWQWKTELATRQVFTACKVILSYLSHFMELTPGVSCSSLIGVISRPCRWQDADCGLQVNGYRWLLWRDIQVMLLLLLTLMMLMMMLMTLITVFITDAADRRMTQR